MAENKAFRRHLLASIRGRDECWPWAGAEHGHTGYGWTAYDGDSILAHRAVYMHLCGSIPEGFEVHHECNNGHLGCVNPLHLRAVTPYENNMLSNSPSALAARATHCKNGHPFDESNTLIVRRAGKRPQRRCRTCHSERQREYGARKAAKP